MLRHALQPQDRARSFPWPRSSPMARARGVDVLVDAAQSWGQVAVHASAASARTSSASPCRNGLPARSGSARSTSARAAWPTSIAMMADEDYPADSILSRVHSGTINFAAALTAPAALDFHDAIGPANKAARLRYLRDRWVSAVRGICRRRDPDARTTGTSRPASRRSVSRRHQHRAQPAPDRDAARSLSASSRRAGPASRAATACASRRPSTTAWPTSIAWPPPSPSWPAHDHVLSDAT